VDEEELCREAEVHPSTVEKVQAEEGDLGAEVEVYQARVDSVFSIS
jgi:hypothetical protein